MTPAYNLVSTEIWRVLLPADWTQKEASNKACVYFAAPDDTKGVYFLSWRPDEAISPKEKCARDFEILQGMPGSNWAIVDRWEHVVGNLSAAGIDCLDKKATYRIICLTITRGAWAARVSFHDYGCVDYDKSRSWFEPLVTSFAFNEEEG